MSASTSTDPRERTLVLGAAGRDFHDFNLLYREDPSVEVVAFTAAQIPDIDGRTYPAELAGPLYPHGIPIVDESGLEGLIARERVDTVVLAYSDLSHAEVMHLASRVVAVGADFVVPGSRRTTLRSRRPVVAVTAVRTGVGKSQTTRYVARLLRDMGLRVVAVRHPMPYGDLAAQACQRFETLDDLLRHDCTIEEREEYEPHIEAGVIVYAGVDYGRILREAEAEADVVLWDGGNNDLPFYAPDLHIVLADPLRPGTRPATTPVRRTCGWPTSCWSPSATRLGRRTSRRSRPRCGRSTRGQRCSAATAQSPSTSPRSPPGAGSSSSRTGRRSPTAR